MRGKGDKRFVELFAGIGLVRKGLEPHGWRCVFSNDIAPDKEEVYRKNFSDSRDFLLGDIWKIDPLSIPKCELITVSFPCIDLSVAGSRKGIDGEHSGTFWAFIRILKGMAEAGSKPKAVLIENVLGFLTSHNGDDFRRAIQAVGELGYVADTFTMDAKYFRPQSRPRLFVLAVDREFRPPEMALLERGGILESGGQVLDADTTLRVERLKKFIYANPSLPWAFFALPKPPPVRSDLSRYIERLPPRSRLWWNEEQVAKLLGQMSPSHLEKVRSLQPSGTYQYFPIFRRIRNHSTRAEVRFDGLAGCLRTAVGGSSRQIVIRTGKGSVRARWMTGREYARLQGAEDSFWVPENRNQAIQAFGDAVCVPVISWIAENLLSKVFPRTRP